jgi:hypothetical protein
MTYELDRARILEAQRRVAERRGTEPLHEATCFELLVLERENWQPPPKVDPDVLAADAIVKAHFPAEEFQNGAYKFVSLKGEIARLARTTREAERAKVRAVLDEEEPFVRLSGTAMAAIARIREKLEA